MVEQERTDRVLLHFFLLFAACYSLGVALLFISAEVCRQHNHAIREKANTTKPVNHTLSGPQPNRALLRKMTSSLQRRKVTFIDDVIPVREDMSRGIGFYYRHFVFDCKVVGNKTLLIALRHFSNNQTVPLS